MKKLIMLVAVFAFVAAAWIALVPGKKGAEMSLLKENVEALVQDEGAYAPKWKVWDDAQGHHCESGGDKACFTRPS